MSSPVHKDGVTLRIFTSNQLINLYSNHGLAREAQSLFDEMPERNVFSWNVIISGHIKARTLSQAKVIFDSASVRDLVIFDSASVRDLVTYNSMLSGYVSPDGYESYALELFIEMLRDLYKIGIYEFTLTTMVNLFAKLSMLSYGRQVHSYMVKTANDKSFAQNDYEEESLKLFVCMLHNGVKCNEHTFASLLSACTGLRNLKLGKEIYACVLRNGMIDLYGRANQLEKALSLLKKIPIEQQDAIILGAFLNACRLNKNAELTKEVEENLLKIEGNNGARYVQLANVYAAEGNWAEMGRIRKQMRGKEAKKFAGCSWIYLDNGVHIFTSGDRTHRKAYSIYSMLACLNTVLYEVSGVIC
ncbi:hypothetical protein GH714_041708 [Hevea brasiliensis]|uniref:Pentatricopeptide repeat-containing protein n=1 Tax=Hevea brasiliensis TaxID=3981 RepID=A0A6A6MTK8_HEVBR|nr:hypothetical protein GH714_041708 [Hevea brasiliensis]